MVQSRIQVVIQGMGMHRRRLGIEWLQLRLLYLVWMNRKPDSRLQGHVLVSLSNNPDLRMCKAYHPLDLYTNIADIIRHP